MDKKEKHHKGGKEIKKSIDEAKSLEEHAQGLSENPAINEDYLTQESTPSPPEEYQQPQPEDKGTIERGQNKPKVPESEYLQQKEPCEAYTSQYPEATDDEISSELKGSAKEQENKESNAPPVNFEPAATGAEKIDDWSEEQSVSLTGIKDSADPQRKVRRKYINK